MKTRYFYLWMIFMAGFNTNLHAQSKFWKSKDAYLGQKPPSDTPQIFDHNLLTQRDTFPMGRVAFSDDGKEFYYATNINWSSNKDMRVRYLKYEQGKWNGPFVLNALYQAPTFSVDNKTLYLSGGKSDGKHSFVWQSKRTGNGWTEPIVYLMKDYGLYNFMPTLSGVCYVGSNANQGDRKDFSTYDICTLTMKGKDTVIQSLGAPINTPGFDGDFYIASDESYMIVSAKETKTFECELYISFHKPDNSWTDPVSLGPLINDGVAHRWGEYVTPDGKYLFYTKGTSPADCQVYWVRFDTLLKQLKPSM
jgi:hypothetical protein